MDRLRVVCMKVCVCVDCVFLVRVCMCVAGVKPKVDKQIVLCVCLCVCVYICL